MSLATYISSYDFNLLEFCPLLLFYSHQHCSALVLTFLPPMPGGRDTPALHVSNRLKLQQLPNSEADGFVHWWRGSRYSFKV